MVLNLLSIWTGWFFTINEQNVYMRGPLFFLQNIGAIGMLLISQQSGEGSPSLPVIGRKDC